MTIRIDERPRTESNKTESEVGLPRKQAQCWTGTELQAQRDVSECTRNPTVNEPSVAYFGPDKPLSRSNSSTHQIV
jgi:hypothetical protein